MSYLDSKKFVIISLTLNIIIMFVALFLVTGITSLFLISTYFMIINIIYVVLLVMINMKGNLLELYGELSVNELLRRLIK